MRYKKAYIVSKFDPISKAVDKVLRGSVAVVLDGQRYVGIIDDRNSNLNVPVSTKCGTIAIKAPRIKENDSLEKILNKFLAGHFRALPVEKDGSIIGVLDRVEVLREIKAKKAVDNIALNNVVDKKIYSVDVSATLAEAKKIMRAKDVHKLAVTEKKKIVGVISTFDFLTLVKPRKRDKAMLIEEVKKMEKTKRVKDLYRPAPSLPISKTLYDAIDFMIKEKQSSIILTSRRKPVAVITAMDIFKFVSTKKESVDVLISGLKEDLYFEPALRNGLLAALGRFKRYVNSVSVRVKKGKSVVELQAKVNGEYPMNLKSSDYDLGLAAQKLFAEIKENLRRYKSKKKSKKRQ